MRLIYDIFFFVFAALYVPVMAFKGKFHAGFSQKFGKVPLKISRLKKPVWIHAVSVGEALVAARLCEGIKESLPGTSVVISTTTKTGNDMAKRSAMKADGVFYYPIDIRGIIKKTIDAVGPAVYVIVETELWPNMLEECRFREVPVILANGRISDRSFDGYRRLGFVMRKMLGCFSVFCMQTPRDAERIKVLGADTAKVRVTGNIKFDAAFSGEKDIEVRKVSAVFPSEKKVIVAGSTHFPEESGIIDEFVKMSSSGIRAKLVIAPRHIERKDAVRIYVEKAGLKCCFFSDAVCSPAPGISEAHVMVVDTIGHLKDLYSMADVVFIGGSIARKGGQNPIEAAKWGKALVFGPNMHNFREIARDFIDSGAAIMAEDISGLGKAMAKILSDDSTRDDMGNKARAVIDRNLGAVSRTVDAVKECGCFLNT
jgi:3-deoxy-D-manno-octulosonic-acid transferase